MHWYIFFIISLCTGYVYTDLGPELSCISFIYDNYEDLQKISQKAKQLVKHTQYNNFHLNITQWKKMDKNRQIIQALVIIAMGAGEPWNSGIKTADQIEKIYFIIKNLITVLYVKFMQHAMKIKKSTF